MTVAQYVDAFRQRVRANARPGQPVVDEPGLVALVGTSASALDGRVLAHEDRGVDVLAECLPTVCARVVTVLSRAEACHRLMADQPGYRAEPSTAMVCDDLPSIEEPDLCCGLVLRPIGEHDAPAPGDVTLEDAAAAAMRADAGAAPADSLDGFVSYLRSVPHARYLAAVDGGGTVRATAATALWGEAAGVFFVDTDRDWRRRGIGTAMTAAALRDAARLGARTAILDSSRLGLGVYRRLGFDAVSDITMFVRTSA
jgi:GNAT superfamily N-acetyltransferase